MPDLLLISLATLAVTLAVVAAAARRALGRSRTTVATLERELAATREDPERDRLRAMLEATPMALVLFSETGRIVDTNEAARALLFESQPARGLNFLALLERAPEPLRHALLSSRDELFTLAKQGERETFHLAKRPLLVGGEAHTLVAVKPMGVEIARQEVATLKKVIRAISHEINNSLGPVTSLVGSARILAGRPDGPPKLGKIFDTVEERTRHLQTFLDGYARLAKIPEPRPENAPWAPVLDALRAMWPRLVIAPPPQPTAFFDPAQLQQVLINLVKNANEAGGPEDEVAIEIVRPPDGGTEVRVIDRGVGMTDEQLEGALRPFFTTKPSGSGIGLTLCREIVEQHHGRLRLQRRDGGGMVVSFWLPDREGAMPRSLIASRVRLDLTRA